jgi:DNA (cytosine-5)-methyltransferase 1
VTHVAPRPIRIMSLCAGYGGLDLGLHAALRRVGRAPRTVCYVERETYPAAILAARMADGALDAAPVWSDLTTLDCEPWRDRVDCVAAGFPCQPHSLAGKRRGTDDERWIWPAIVNIIRDVGARWVALENVRGLLTSGGFDRVLADLAGLGFDAEWSVLRASDVGASHERARVFVLAYRDGQGGSQPGGPEPDFGRRARDGGDGVADATGERRQNRAPVTGARGPLVGAGTRTNGRIGVGSAAARIPPRVGINTRGAASVHGGETVAAPGRGGVGGGQQESQRGSGGEAGAGACCEGVSDSSRERRREGRSFRSGF